MATGLVERLCDLPFQPQSFWKRTVVAGWKIVQSTASQWNGPFFLFVCLFLFLFLFFFNFCFCLFFIQMKNKCLCWIVGNYAVCLSVIFIWNLFEVVEKVRVGPLILNFLFVFVLFCLLFFFFFFFETDPIPSCLCVARVFASIILIRSKYCCPKWKNQSKTSENQDLNYFLLETLAWINYHQR